MNNRATRFPTIATPNTVPLYTRMNLKLVWRGLRVGGIGSCKGLRMASSACKLRELVKIDRPVARRIHGCKEFLHLAVVPSRTGLQCARGSGVRIQISSGFPVKPVGTNNSRDLCWICFGLRAIKPGANCLAESILDEAGPRHLGVSQNQGYLFGVPMVYYGLYFRLPVQGNYHLEIQKTSPKILAS